MTKAEYQKKWRENNKERIAANNKRYYESNKEKIFSDMKKYYEANKEEIKSYKNEYKKNRIKKDPLFRMKVNIRNSISNYCRRKNLTKKSKTEDILGIESWDFFMDHLSKTFEVNYGEKYSPDIHRVHIDHIIPMSTAKNESDLIKLNHYSNLQLLRAEDNLKKSDKLDWSVNDNL